MLYMMRIRGCTPSSTTLRTSYLSKTIWNWRKRMIMTCLQSRPMAAKACSMPDWCLSIMEHPQNALVLSKTQSDSLPWMSVTPMAGVLSFLISNLNVMKFGQGRLKDQFWLSLRKLRRCCKRLAILLRSNLIHKIWRMLFHYLSHTCKNHTKYSFSS